MMHCVPIHDIILTREFYDDFDKVPDRIKNKMNRLIDMILEIKKFPNSMNVHPTFRNDLWIGVVTKHNLAWRTLLWIDDGTVIFHRLFTHEQMDKYLDNI